MLNDRQERFCKEYIIDGNASAAYVRAGYSAKYANSLASRMTANASIQARIAELMAAKDAELIASADEVLRYLTSVMRGESESEIVVVEGCGDGMSSAVKVTKLPDEPNKLKAAELLGKRYGLYTENVNLNVELPRIVDDVPALLAAQRAEGKHE